MIRLRESNKLMTDLEVLDTVKELIETYIDKSCKGDEEKIEGCINYLDVLEAITGHDRDFIKGYLKGYLKGFVKGEIRREQ